VYSVSFVFKEHVNVFAVFLYCQIKMNGELSFICY